MVRYALLLVKSYQNIDGDVSIFPPPCTCKVFSHHGGVSAPEHVHIMGLLEVLLCPFRWNMLFGCNKFSDFRHQFHVFNSLHRPPKILKRNKVGWSWWIVFQPLWVLMLGHLTGYCLDCLLARKLAAVAEGLEEEELSDVRARLHCAFLFHTM